MQNGCTVFRMRPPQISGIIRPMLEITMNALAQLLTPSYSRHVDVEDIKGGLQIIT